MAKQPKLTISGQEFNDLAAARTALEGKDNPITRAKLTLATCTEIVKLRVLDGLEFVEIAERVGLSDRQCRAYFQEWQDEDKTALVRENGVDIVHEALAGLRALRQEAAAVYRAADESNVNGQIGALKLMADTRMREIELRQSSGLLPKNLGRIQVDLDMRFVLESIIHVFEQYAVPKEAGEKLVELLETTGTEVASGLLNP